MTKINKSDKMKDAQYKKVPVTENGKGKTDTPKAYGYGIRHVQAFLFFMSLSLGYIARGHLGVTIVAMTNLPTRSSPVTLKTIVLNANDTVGNNGTVHNEVKHFVQPVNETGQYVDSQNTSIWNIYRTYDWPKSTQEMVQGAFFWGYFLMMFPTGLVVQRWGGQRPVQMALLINGVISIAIPWITAWGGWKALCACRFAQGLTQSGFYPAMHTLLANWVPIGERASLTSYVYTGAGFGTIVAFQLGGVLADSPWGWPSTFWVTGVLCLVGFILLTIFGADKPVDHKTMTQEEKDYIIGYYGDQNTKSAKTPWRQILTSRHAWAGFSGHVGSGVTFIFFLTQVPTYMHAILQFNIKSSGLLSSLPYIFTFFSTIAFGRLSDFFINRKIFTIKTARIISNTLGGMATAVLITAVSFTESPALAVALFTAMLTFHSAGHTGWMVNYIDLAPNYSGALMALGNTLCNSVIILLPILISSIVTDVTNPFQWRITFLLMGGLAAVANAIYVMFMSAEIQSWNSSDESNGYCRTSGPEELKLENYPEKK